MWFVASVGAMAGIRAEVGRAGVLVAVAVVAGTGLAGCTSGKKSAGPGSSSVTLTASTTASGTAPVAPSTLSGAPSVRTARKTPAKAVPALPRCETVLPPTAVDKAMSHHLSGSAFVVNKPDPTIGQRARINCQYGLSAPPPASAHATRTPVVSAPAGAVPQVEVSVSLYATNAAAGARITATDSQWRSLRATAHRVVVGTHPATVLTGYGRPLLVLASGVRTVAVSMRPGAVTANRVDAALTEIAQSALSGSGG